MDDVAAGTRDELYDRLLARLPDWLEPHVRQDIAKDILDLLPPVRGIGDNNPPEATEVESEADRLLRIDPEKLVVVGTEQLSQLFDLHYPALKERGAELLAQCKKWQDDHRTTSGGWKDIADDDENAEVADFIVQLDDFAKEVEEARKRVKASVYNAGIAIDGWFTHGLADPVMDVRGVTKTVSGRKYYPAPGTFQFAQTKFLNDKVERERQERERARLAAEAEANRKAEEARVAAEQEAARARALVNEGMAPEEAQAVAAIATDRAAEAADNAAGASALIGSYASERPTDIVRTHTAVGTTIGLKGSWEFRLIDKVELCRAITGLPSATQIQGWRDSLAAILAQTKEGSPLNQRLSPIVAEMTGWPKRPMPDSMVTTNDPAIRAMVRDKAMPLRECPGLQVWQELNANRRGPRS